jgi:5-methylcytosine-specific restriction endonuclease McrA
MLSRREQLNHPLWQRKRLEIMNRDNFKCLICGADNKKLNVHHICYFPDLHLWEYDNELLKTVCEDHHEQLTYDLPKIAGLMAWDILTQKIQVP